MRQYKKICLCEALTYKHDRTTCRHGTKEIPAFDGPDIDTRFCRMAVDRAVPCLADIRSRKDLHAIPVEDRKFLELEGYTRRDPEEVVYAIPIWRKGIGHAQRAIDLYQRLAGRLATVRGPGGKSK